MGNELLTANHRIASSRPLVVTRSRHDPVVSNQPSAVSLRRKIHSLHLISLFTHHCIPAVLGVLASLREIKAFPLACSPSLTQDAKILQYQGVATPRSLRVTFLPCPSCSLSSCVPCLLLSAVLPRTALQYPLFFLFFLSLSCFSLATSRLCKRHSVP